MSTKDRNGAQFKLSVIMECMSQQFFVLILRHEDNIWEEKLLVTICLKNQ